MNASVNFFKFWLLLFLTTNRFNLIKSNSNDNDLSLDSNKTSCVKSFIKENRTHEIKKCILLDYLSTTRLKFQFECKIVLLRVNEKLVKAVDSMFSLYGRKDENITQVEFYWSKDSEENKYRNNSDNRLKVNLTNDTNENFFNAKLTLEEIEYETNYEICTKIDDLFEDNCCNVELKEIEEESNIYLSLLVLGIAIVFLVLIIIVFWLCPPTEFHSIDEMLEKMPTSHVEALKILVTEQDMDENNDEEQGLETDIPENFNLRSRRATKQDLFNNRIRINANPTEFDNPAFDNYDEDEDDVEHQLKFQALKIRRMSMGTMAPRGQNGDVPIKKKGGVRFVDDEDNGKSQMNEMDNLRIKLLNESKRRASIKPFKKTFNLDISSDSDN
jgi:hypothetical protein